MHACTECGRDFTRFDTPGKCPVCAEWLRVTCPACDYSAGAKRFIDAGRKCPKCGKRVSIPGASTKIHLVLAMLLLAGAGVWLAKSIQDFFVNQG
ncbi:MAG: hypothetical protein CMJ64_22295 [Planctomycetaceae bacterium]|jgi:hypothetical protein|nr:hypothetical protein [Planctomycetaceae bacterium]